MAASSFNVERISFRSLTRIHVEGADRALRQVANLCQKQHGGALTHRSLLQRLHQKFGPLFWQRLGDTEGLELLVSYWGAAVSRALGSRGLPPEHVVPTAVLAQAWTRFLTRLTLAPHLSFGHAEQHGLEIMNLLTQVLEDEVMNAYAVSFVSANEASPTESVVDEHPYGDEDPTYDEPSDNVFASLLPNRTLAPSPSPSLSNFRALSGESPRPKATDPPGSRRYFITRKGSSSRKPSSKKPKKKTRRRNRYSKLREEEEEEEEEDDEDGTCSDSQ